MRCRVTPWLHRTLLAAGAQSMVDRPPKPFQAVTFGMHSKQFWMVRSGERIALAGDFEREDCVAIGSAKSGDFTCLTTDDSIRQRVDDRCAEEKPQSGVGSTTQAHKFRSVMKIGDAGRDLYGPKREYRNKGGVARASNHIRRVDRQGRGSKTVLEKATAARPTSMLTSLAHSNQRSKT